MAGKPTARCRADGSKRMWAADGHDNADLIETILDAKNEVTIRRRHLDHSRTATELEPWLESADNRPTGTGCLRMVVCDRHRYGLEFPVTQTNFMRITDKFKLPNKRTLSTFDCDAGTFSRSYSYTNDAVTGVNILMKAPQKREVGNYGLSMHYEFETGLTTALLYGTDVIVCRDEPGPLDPTVIINGHPNLDLPDDLAGKEYEYERDKWYFDNIHAIQKGHTQRARPALVTMIDDNKLKFNHPLALPCMFLSDHIDRIQEECEHGMVQRKHWEYLNRLGMRGDDHGDDDIFWIDAMGLENAFTEQGAKDRFDAKGLTAKLDRHFLRIMFSQRGPDWNGQCSKFLLDLAKELNDKAPLPPAPVNTVLHQGSGPGAQTGPGAQASPAPNTQTNVQSPASPAPSVASSQSPPTAGATNPPVPPDPSLSTQAVASTPMSSYQLSPIVTNVQRSATAQSLSASSTPKRFQGVLHETLKESLEYNIQMSKSLLYRLDSMKQNIQLQLDVCASITGQSANEFNARIAWDTSRDSTSMKILAVITAFFLPGTFVATFMSMGIWNWQWTNDAANGNQHQGVVSPYWTIFIKAAIPATFVTLLGWFGWWVWEIIVRENNYMKTVDADIDGSLVETWVRWGLRWRRDLQAAFTSKAGNSKKSWVAVWREFRKVRVGEAVETRKKRLEAKQKQKDVVKEKWEAKAKKHTQSDPVQSPPQVQVPQHGQGHHVGQTQRRSQASQGGQPTQQTTPPSQVPNGVA